MRVAVSGASGLIGGWVKKHFSCSHQVISIGRGEGVDIPVDFAKPRSLENVDLSGLDLLIHCAGVTDEDFATNVKQAWEQGVGGTRALLERVKAAAVPRFAYISTAHVYGPEERLVTEATEPNPASDYARAHLQSEQLVSQFASKHDFQALILRPQAVFGVPVTIETFKRWTLIPYAFPVAALHSQRIILRTSGLQIRNFISARDVAATIERCLLNSTACGAQIINSLGPDTMTVFDFATHCATICESLIGKPCRIERPTAKVSSESMGPQIVSSSQYGAARDGVEEYLREFYEFLLSDLKQGIKWGLG